MSLTDREFERITTVVRNNRVVTFLTGAGISAESGVSTFRGEDGLWNEYSPEEVATPEAFRRDPDRVRSFYEMRRRRVRGVEPSRSHEIMARIAGEIPGVHTITQNVDNLHERAGQSEVLHVHGELMNDRCVDCGQTLSAEAERDTCPDCDGPLRPDVVWFGESLDRTVLRRARNWLTSTELLVVVGTSLEVAPVSSFPRLVLESGATLLEVNPNPVYDGSNDDIIVFEGQAGAFFKQWSGRLQDEDILGIGTDT